MDVKRVIMSTHELKKNKINTNFSTNGDFLETICGSVLPLVQIAEHSLLQFSLVKGTLTPGEPGEQFAL